MKLMELITRYESIEILIHNKSKAMDYAIGKKGNDILSKIFDQCDIDEINHLYTLLTDINHYILNASSKIFITELGMNILCAEQHVKNLRNKYNIYNQLYNKAFQLPDEYIYQNDNFNPDIYILSETLAQIGNEILKFTTYIQKTKIETEIPVPILEKNEVFHSFSKSILETQAAPGSSKNEKE